MIHLLILFPTLVLLTYLSYYHHKKDSSNIITYYFVYFFGFWSVCTLFNGIIELMKITGNNKIIIGSVIGAPFYYFAMAALAIIPFKIYKKWDVVSMATSAIISLTGVFIGIANYFIKIEKISVDNQFLFDFLNLFSSTNFRITTTFLFLIPVSIFFMFEAVKAMSTMRVSLFIISIGILIVSLMEPQHISNKHSEFGDFGVTVGFILMLIGIFWSVLVQPRIQKEDRAI